MHQSEQAHDAVEVQVFLFADLAGFTALTEAHGDELAADLVEEFSRATTRLLSQYEAELVKIIGDALMLRVPAPASAIELGLALTGPILAEYGYPAVHVGMHYGPAVNRAGEWIGATINLAARISGLAAGGEVLLSAATRTAAVAVNGVKFRDRGSQRVRNVSEPVHIFAAIPRDAKEATVWFDPVCRMAVDPSRGAGALIHEGLEYHFCSLECAERFAAAPGNYDTR